MCRAAAILGEAHGHLMHPLKFGGGIKKREICEICWRQALASGQTESPGVLYGPQINISQPPVPLGEGRGEALYEVARQEWIGRL